MEYMYAIIPFDLAQELGLAEIRRNVDNMVIVNQDDLMGYGSPRNTFASKVRAAGGQLLTATEARELINNNQ